MENPDLYKCWLDAFVSINTPAISRDTAARILSVVYVHGNNEAFVSNKKFLAEIDHIKHIYHIGGGEEPDGDVVKLLRKYVQELEQYDLEHDTPSESEAVFHSYAPEWAHKLFTERYGIKLIN